MFPATLSLQSCSVIIPYHPTCTVLTHRAEGDTLSGTQLKHLKSPHTVTEIGHLSLSQKHTHTHTHTDRPCEGAETCRSSPGQLIWPGHVRCCSGECCVTAVTLTQISSTAKWISLTLWRAGLSPLCTAAEQLGRHATDLIRL